MDNLKFVLDYNSRHTSHWVRRRRQLLVGAAAACGRGFMAMQCGAVAMLGTHVIAGHPGAAAVAPFRPTAAASPLPALPPLPPRSWAWARLPT